MRWRSKWVWIWTVLFSIFVRFLILRVFALTSFEPFSFVASIPLLTLSLSPLSPSPFPLSALGMPEIERLQVTYHLLSPAAKANLLHLKTSLSYDGSYKAYRRMLSESSAGGVCYLGLLFRDLLLTHEGYPSKEKGLMNVHKWRKMFGLVQNYHVNLVNKVTLKNSHSIRNMFRDIQESQVFFLL